MNLSDLLARDAILAAAHATTRKQLFQEIAQQACAIYGLDAKLVADALLARELLGSTAMGGGVAMPHAQLSGLKSMVGLFARLPRPVDFQASDGRGVDLVFVLLAPEGRHPARLCALAHVCRMLRDRYLCSTLRQTSDPRALYALVTEADREPRQLRAT